MSFSKKHPETAGGNRERDSDIIPIFDFNDAVKEQSFRLIGPVLSYDNFWVEIETQKGNTRIPLRGIDLDPYTDTYTQDVCPYRKSGLRASRVYYVNAIWRQKQDLQPAKLPKLSASESKVRTVMTTPDYPEGWKMHMADQGTKSWTPVVVLALSANMVTELLSYINENVHTIKSKKTGKTVEKTFDATDPRRGFDIKIKYNPKGTGTGKYRMTMGDVTPLTEEELEYLVHKIDRIKLPTVSEATTNWASLQSKLSGESSTGGKGGKSARNKLSDDDADDDSPRKPKRSRNAVDDDDEDEAPRKSRRASDDDDDETDDDEEDEAPRKTRKRRSDDDIPF